MNHENPLTIGGTMFERFAWKPDRMLLDDLVFRLEHFRSDAWDIDKDYFRFFKTKELVEQYEVFFSHFPPRHLSGLFEIGTFDGGSTVFWNEALRPEKHVSIDLTKREDSPYFRRYIKSRRLGDRIKTIWGIDQSDKAQLRSLVAKYLDGNLDMVIDDASHLYWPTRASFEALFPLCVPGGLYIIEDWAWGHWPGFITPDHPWANEEVPTRLVTELIEAAGTSAQLISNVVVCQGFTVIERGPMQIQNPIEFNLDQHILRRSSHK